MKFDHHYERGVFDKVRNYWKGVSWFLLIFYLATTFKYNNIVQEGLNKSTSQNASGLEEQINSV